MAVVYYNRMGQVSTIQGTGQYIMEQVIKGFQSFNPASGNQVYYVAVGNTTGAWEVGLGTVTAASPLTYLSRDTIYGSSNNGSAVVWTGEQIQVKFAYPANLIEQIGADASIAAAAVSAIAAYAAQVSLQASAVNTEYNEVVSIKGEVSTIYTNVVSAVAGINSVYAATVSVYDAAVSAVAGVSTVYEATLSTYTATVSVYDATQALVSGLAPNTPEYVVAASTALLPNSREIISGINTTVIFTAGKIEVSAIVPAQVTAITTITGDANVVVGAATETSRQLSLNSTVSNISTQNISEVFVNAGTVTGQFTMSFASANYYKAIVSTNVSLSLTGFPANKATEMFLSLRGGGAATVTFPAVVSGWIGTDGEIVSTFASLGITLNTTDPNFFIFFTDGDSPVYAKLVT